MNIDYKKLLHGYYEEEGLPVDFTPERSVPDFAFNILHLQGLLYRPVIDEHYLKNGGKKPIWPDEKSFAVCLTHDVDVVSIYSLKQFLRARQAQLITANSFFKKIKTALGFFIDAIRTAGNKGKKDPLHCYERWLEVEKEIGANSSFFFWPGIRAVKKRHYTDCMYALSDLVVFDDQKCTVAEMIREIDYRECEIGLHPSWYSFNDVDELKRQKEALEKVLDHDIVSVRQHFLHYDIRITPHVHAEAGFKYDSTLGFNDNIGFRFGTCRPWKLYDLKAKEELSVIEIPLIIQDGAMLNPDKGMRIDENTAFQYIVHIAGEVEKVGGVLTLLWHPNSIIKPDWWNLYLRTLEYLKRRNAWFGSIREIGESIKWNEVFMKDVL